MDILTIILGDMATGVSHFVVPQSSRDMQLIAFLASLSIPIWGAVATSTFVRLGARFLYHPPKNRKTNSPEKPETSAP